MNMRLVLLPTQLQRLQSNAADEPLAVVVDLDERPLAEGAT
jgi:hypothetical protein